MSWKEKTERRPKKFLEVFKHKKALLAESQQWVEKVRDLVNIMRESNWAEEDLQPYKQFLAKYDKS